MPSYRLLQIYLIHHPCLGPSLLLKLNFRKLFHITYLNRVIAQAFFFIISLPSIFVTNSLLPYLNLIINFNRSYIILPSLCICVKLNLHNSNSTLVLSLIQMTTTSDVQCWIFTWFGVKMRFSFQSSFPQTYPQNIFYKHEMSTFQTTMLCY